MSVISIANTKGGSGKTNLAFGVALTLVENGLSVAVIDADPQGAISDMLLQHFANRKVSVALDPTSGSAVEQWQVKIPVISHENLSLYLHVHEDDVLDTIQDAHAKHDMVLVDLQGSANQAMLLAMQSSHLVLAPANSGRADITGIRRIMKVLHNARRMQPDRNIKGAVILVRTPPGTITRNVDKHARSLLKEISEPVHVFQRELCQRAAFEEMTYTGELPDRKTHASARANINAVVDELVQILEASAEAAE